MTSSSATGAAAVSKHWSQIARQWGQVGPPLRPSAPDLAFYNDAIGRWIEAHGVPRALILGVTPELYRLPWPWEPMAVDHTQAMIDGVWPGSRGSAICAEWTALPRAVGMRDLVLCDGGLHLLAYPHTQSALADNLREVVAPGGLCIFRLFVPPREPESADAVLGDLLAGRIANLNLLKLRLGMALQSGPAAGVALQDVWNALSAAAPDFERLSSEIGWPVDHLRAIDTYRDSRDRYHFVTLDEVRALFCACGSFEVASVDTPAYELGERCPTVVLRRRD
ncbi:MAG: hypothetical protein KIT18_13945 [Burkholderiales bacterium]|nr:hypothetical protein [Burkholderiales bacterium]